MLANRYLPSEAQPTNAQEHETRRAGQASCFLSVCINLSSHLSLRCDLLVITATRTSGPNIETRSARLGGWNRFPQFWAKRTSTLPSHASRGSVFPPESLSLLPIFSSPCCWWSSVAVTASSLTLQKVVIASASLQRYLLQYRFRSPSGIHTYSTCRVLRMLYIDSSTPRIYSTSYTSDHLFVSFTPSSWLRLRGLTSCLFLSRASLNPRIRRKSGSGRNKPNHTGGIIISQNHNLTFRDPSLCFVCRRLTS